MAPMASLVPSCPLGNEYKGSQTVVPQYGSGSGDYATPSATHDISRVNYHVKHIDSFAKSLEDVRSCALLKYLLALNL